MPITRSMFVVVAAFAWGLLLAGCDREGGDSAGTPVTEAGNTQSGNTTESVSEGSEGSEEGPSSGATATATQLSSVTTATEIAQERQPDYVRSIGSNGLEDGQFQLPSAIALDDAGRLYALDTTGIQVFDADGEFERRIGGQDIIGAQGLAVQPDGSEIYVTVRPGPGAGADAPAGTGDVTPSGARVVVLGPEGDVVRSVGDAGDGPGQLAAPTGIILNAAGQLVVADHTNRRVEVFDVQGSHVRTIGEPGQGRGQFTSPRALAEGPDGRLYVGQGDDYLVQVFESDGTYVDSFGHTFSDENLFRVGGIAVTTDGRVLVARSANHYLQTFDASNGFSWDGDFGELGRGAVEFNTPLGLQMHAGRLYVTDQQNHRVQVLELP